MNLINEKRGLSHKHEIKNKIDGNRKNERIKKNKKKNNKNKNSNNQKIWNLRFYLKLNK